MRRLRLTALAGVAVGGFGPPFVLAVRGFALSPASLAVVLAMAVAGVVLGVRVVRGLGEHVDMPASAFAWLAILAGAGWGVGFLAALLV